MHELSLAQSIAEIAQKAAMENGGRKVVTVAVRVGELSGVVVDSLTFCFSAITTGTPLEGATLRVEHIPLKARCNDCGTVSPIEDLVFLCSSCGGGNLEIITGRELAVSHIEVDGE